MPQQRHAATDSAVVIVMWACDQLWRWRISHFFPWTFSAVLFKLQIIRVPNINECGGSANAQEDKRITRKWGLRNILSNRPYAPPQKFVSSPNLSNNGWVDLSLVKLGRHRQRSLVPYCRCFMPGVGTGFCLLLTGCPTIALVVSCAIFWLIHFPGPSDDAIRCQGLLPPTEQSVNSSKSVFPYRSDATVKISHVGRLLEMPDCISEVRRRKPFFY